MYRAAEGSPLIFGVLKSIRTIRPMYPLFKEPTGIYPMFQLPWAQQDRTDMTSSIEQISLSMIEKVALNICSFIQ